MCSTVNASTKHADTEFRSTPLHHEICKAPFGILDVDVGELDIELGLIPNQTQNAGDEEGNFSQCAEGELSIPGRAALARRMPLGIGLLEQVFNSNSKIIQQTTDILCSNIYVQTGYKPFWCVLNLTILSLIKIIEKTNNI